MTGPRTPIARRPDRKRLNSGLTLNAAAALRRALLRWYSRHARPLPWREVASPYSVWVSEIMLQQTQVSTVIPYYQRFMDRFPTVERLAAARLERVLELWSGLGYYRRARLMHQGAQEIVARFNGEFPDEYDLARSLPGVGDYTARAVLSIAYQKPLFVLDGNVARVASRLITIRGNVHQKTFRRSVEGILQQLLSRRHPGDFNQAIMQLGQLVCLPRAPHCEACPLQKECKAYRLGAPADFPEPRPRRTAEAHYMAAAALRRGNRVALVRGLDEGLLDDLWNFPAAFGSTLKQARRALGIKLKRSFPLFPRLRKNRKAVMHSITHRRIHVALFSAVIDKHDDGATHAHSRMEGAHLPVPQETVQADPIRWLPFSQFRRAAVSRLARKIARQVEIQSAC